MKAQLSTFIILREDRGLDPTTLIAEALKIGRAPGRDLLLNHPDVSRLHAGIKEIAGRFYLVNLSSSNSTTLNGRLVVREEAVALASGDEIRIGPFFLRTERKDDALVLVVTLQFGLRIGEAEARGATRVTQRLDREVAAAAAPSEVALALDLFWDKRTREKAGRRSPLHPRRPPRLGKARFNWTPTRDLVRPWPFAIFLWFAIVLGGLSIAAAFWYASAYAPEPISDAHSRTSLALMPAVAGRPNAGSCTSCHSLSAGMEGRCASCHTTEVFAASVTKSHSDAGIGCLECHSEHKGTEFSPGRAALNSCTKCHTNKNLKTYNGRRVGTPHGGTLGYPVRDGEWKWKGLDAQELAERPKIAAQRLATDSEQVWRSKQFHALHIYRVRATRGLTGVVGAGPGSPPALSCSSCHRSSNPPDREYPRQTCVQCHSGPADAAGKGSIAAEAPNCVSCHVQHVMDKRHRNAGLLSASVALPAEEP
ncbi:MAG: FHA domain-containing protein [Pyrinomonadaceae bacterium]|nr:FHA domain-containing protein [Pyrinomonadaceae bacterium]